MTPGASSLRASREEADRADVETMETDGESKGLDGAAVSGTGKIL
jgi:hypothetical protein